MIRHASVAKFFFIFRLEEGVNWSVREPIQVAGDSQLIPCRSGEVFERDCCKGPVDVFSACTKDHFGL